jgi:hypothetical protein
MKMIGSLRLLLLLFVVSCASTQNLPEENSQEALLFRTICSQCHSLPHPKQHTSSEWDVSVGIMLRHMESRGVAYSKEDMQKVREYLKRNANKKG